MSLTVAYARALIKILTSQKLAGKLLLETLASCSSVGKSRRSSCCREVSLKENRSRQ